MDNRSVTTLQTDANASTISISSLPNESTAALLPKVSYTEAWSALRSLTDILGRELRGWLFSGLDCDVRFRAGWPCQEQHYQRHGYSPA